MNKKVYVLGMFPYPSGDGLHVGHVRIYTAVDVMARYFRMRSRPASAKALDGLAGEPLVLSPMGWDAFGLPAENAAIKNKVNPQEIVPRNYNNFREQMKRLQFSFDWERELATTDPTYYGITQWIFLELYKKGLIYREQVPINWCPKCKTGLANEEVLTDGTHERCGTVTGKKDLPQWVFKITKYADRLLKDLDGDKGDRTGRPYEGDKLDWPRGILEMQRNWIGKKEGVEIEYRISNKEYRQDTVKVFTTTPVNFGATFLVVAPEHELVNRILSGEYKVEEKYKSQIDEYVKKTQKKSEVERMVEGKEKTGVFTGLYVENHVTGADIPVWIADFVLINVGTGAVQGCPGHDTRDFEFAKKFDLPIKRVVVGEDHDESEIEKPEQLVVKGMKGKMINSDFLDGIDFAEAMHKTMDYFEEKGWGRRVTTYHLRDWVFSRQRYWGEPIPLVYCSKCAISRNKKLGISEESEGKLQIVEQDGKDYAVVPLLEKDLPLTLPDLASYEPTETGESPLSRVSEWVNTTCPRCGGAAKRETDTMPNWAGSCWYHLAFAFWKNSANQRISKSANQQVGESASQTDTKTILDEYRETREKPYTDFWREVARPEIDKWLPVDWYLGGAEHAVLHLLYARFWNKVLFDLGHLSFPEPYLRLRSVGMVLAPDGRKMSKSWGNVINPDDVVREYGSDPVRLYEMFMGPWDQTTSWDPRALVGMKRFLERVLEVTSTKSKITSGLTSPVLASQLSKLVDKVEKGIVEQKFNTCIAGMMEFVNAWKNSDLVLSYEHAKNFAQIMSPFAPATAQKLWETINPEQGDSLPVRQVGLQERIEDSPWPELSATEVEVPVTIAVQVNGRLRSTIEVSRQMSGDREAVVKVAMEDEKIAKWVGGEIKKIIFVPGRLVNLVV